MASLFPRSSRAERIPPNTRNSSGPEVSGTHHVPRMGWRSAYRKFIRPRRKHILLGLLLILVSRGASLVLPGATKYLIDDVVVGKDLVMLRTIVLVVVASVVVQSITSFLLTRLLSVEAQLMISDLRAEVQRKVMSLPVSYFDNAKSGALVSRIMNDVEGVRNLVGTGLVQLVGGTITAIASLFFLLRISPTMTLWTLLPVGLFAVIARKAFGRIRPIFRERGAINAEVTGRLTESLNGVRVIKGFNSETHEEEVFSAGVQRLFENVRKSLTSTALITSSSTLLLGLASAGIMGLGGYKMVQGQLTVGDFLAFTLYLGFMIAPIVQMSNIGSQLTEAFAGLDRTEEIMAMAPENDPLQRPVRMEAVKGHIQFDNVRFSYENGVEVLHGITFDAPAGAVVALVGSSGSGKTTIAGLAASYLTPTAGTVRIDGTDLSTVSLDTYRARLGVVLQDDFLFEGTIRDNIQYPRPHASDAEVMKAVKGAYVDEFTDRFELGLDTVIGERGVKLSGGQRQRVAIARAILADPAVLILDEATSNLDTQSEALVQQSLAELVKDRTTFVIAHRLSTIRKATQILVIESGRIVERGTHEELIALGGRYGELHKYQARI